MSDPSVTERTRSTVKKWVSALNDLRLDDMAELFGDTGTWTIIGRKDRALWGGPSNGAELSKGAGSMLLKFDNWRYDIINLIVENDKAVVEGSAVGKGPPPLAYQNKYMMRFIVGEDGKIKDLTEALDAYDIEAYIASMEEWKRLQDSATA